MQSLETCAKGRQLLGSYVTSKNHPKIADLFDEKSQLVYIIQVRDTMTKSYT